MNMHAKSIFLAIAAIAVSGPSFALEGVAANGEAVFKKCAACHVTEAGKNKVGPSLAGLIGRVPGTVADFKYSKAMVEFGTGKVWDEAALTNYLADPKGVVKGTKMTFVGLKQQQDIADVIAYLKQFSQ